MDRVNLADATAHLSKLVDRVESGEQIEIVRRGKTVARLSAIESPRKPVDLAMLQPLASELPREDVDAVTFVRQMRDSDRY